MQVTERWGAGVETLLGSRLKMAVLKVNDECKSIYQLFMIFENKIARFEACSS